MRIVVHHGQYTIYSSPLSPPRTHTLGITLLIFLLLVMLPFLILGGRSFTKNSPATIAVEHALPLAVSLTVKHAPNGSLFEIGNAKDDMYVSLPAAWKRREVRGVPITSVTMEGEGFGFTRWRLPAQGSVAFFASPKPSSLTLHNPSSSHLTLHLILLDLEDNHTETRTILINKEEQKVLW